MLTFMTWIEDDYFHVILIHSFLSGQHLPNLILVKIQNWSQKIITSGFSGILLFFYDNLKFLKFVIYYYAIKLTICKVPLHMIQNYMHMT